MIQVASVVSVCPSQKTDRNKNNRAKRTVNTLKPALHWAPESSTDAIASARVPMDNAHLLGPPPGLLLGAQGTQAWIEINAMTEDWENFPDHELDRLMERLTVLRMHEGGCALCGAQREWITRRGVRQSIPLRSCATAHPSVLSRAFSPQLDR